MNTLRQDEEKWLPSHCKVVAHGLRLEWPPMLRAACHLTIVQEREGENRFLLAGRQNPSHCPSSNLSEKWHLRRCDGDQRRSGHLSLWRREPPL